MSSRPPREYLSPKNLSYRGVPREFHDASLDEYPIDPETKRLLQAYIENMEVMRDDFINLILYGSNGSGKTYLASLIVKEAYRYRFTSFIITLQSLIDLYFKRSDPEHKEKWDDIMECDFLVIDEVGKEGFDSKMYNISIFEEALRKRDTIGRPYILCTNLDLEVEGGLYDQYGKSIRSLIEGKALKLEFDGDDYRKSVSKKKKGMRILLAEEED
ncbi:DNA replication protein DnaC [compost metagenome]